MAGRRSRFGRALGAGWIAGALALLASPSTGAASPRLGGIGLRLLDVPATTLQEPRARLYIVDHLAPGTTVHRRIAVSNTTASSIPLSLYPAAATVVRGSFTGAAAHTPNELSSWTSVRPARVHIRAGGQVTASVTITVPQNASPGERYGVIWAEARSSGALGGHIVQVSRVGLRLYLSVGRGGPPAADFAIDSLTARRSADGRPVVIASVHNTGGRALDMSGTLRLRSGPGALSAGPFPASLGTTLGIDQTEPVTIALDRQLPAGPWDAQVVLHSGLLSRRARSTITFPGVERSQTHYLAIVGLALLVASCLGALFVALRRRRARQRRRQCSATDAR